MQRIRRMDVTQMAKTLDALYFLLGFIISVPVLLFMSSVANTRSGLPGFGSGFGIGMIIAMPVIYGVIGFIGGALPSVRIDFGVSARLGGVKSAIKSALAWTGPTKHSC